MVLVGLPVVLGNEFMRQESVVTAQGTYKIMKSSVFQPVGVERDGSMSAQKLYPAGIVGGETNAQTSQNYMTHRIHLVGEKPGEAAGRQLRDGELVWIQLGSTPFFLSRNMTTASEVVDMVYRTMPPELMNMVENNIGPVGDDANGKLNAQQKRMLEQFLWQVHIWKEENYQRTEGEPISYVTKFNLVIPSDNTRRFRMFHAPDNVKVYLIDQFSPYKRNMRQTDVHLMGAKPESFPQPVNHAGRNAALEERRKLEAWSLPSVVATEDGKGKNVDRKKEKKQQESCGITKSQPVKIIMWVTVILLVACLIFAIVKLSCKGKNTAGQKE